MIFLVIVTTIILQTPITDFKLQCREISRESQVEVDETNFNQTKKLID